MKWLLIFTSMLAMASTCPEGNFAACSKYLKSVHAKNQGRTFVEKYDEVCAANKTFQCIKIVVRGSVADEMKMQGQERGPQSALYAVTLEEEKFIFVFAKK